MASAPPAREGAPPVLTPRGALFLAFVHFTAILGIMIVLTAMAPGDGKTVRPLTAFAGEITGALLALYVALSRYAPGEPMARALGLAAPRGRQLGIVVAAVIAGAALAPLAQDVTARLVGFWPMDDADAFVAADASESAFAIMVALAGAVIIGPAAEEILYRGFVLPRLARTAGGARAIAIVTALSAAIVVNPRFMPATLIIALPMAIAGLAGRTAWAVVAGRMAHETIALGLPRLKAAGVIASTMVGCAAIGAAWALRVGVADPDREPAA